MKVHIKIRIDDQADAAIFRSYSGAAGKRHWDVQIEFGQLDKDWDSLIITDKTEYLDKYAGIPAVYIGKSEDVEDRIDRIYDVWPKVESEKSRRMRFERLIANLRNANNSWLYRYLLSTLIDSDTDAVSFKDVSDRYVLVNNTFEHAYGKSREDMYERGSGYVLDTKGESDAENEYALSEQDHNVLANGQIISYDEMSETVTGQRHYRTRKSPLIDPSGELFGILTISEDMTEKGLMSPEVADFLENLPFPILVCDLSYKTIRMNYSFRNQVSGNAEFDFASWKKGLKPTGEKKVNLERKSVSQEFYIDYFGKPRFFYVSEHAIKDAFGNVTGYFIILRDTTIERTLEKSVLSAANTDGLTGLYNKRYIVDHINNNHGKPMTLLYMDLDNFKEINNRFSRSRGDEVLIKTAKFIQECFPRGIAARPGGDEFAVVLDGYADKAAIEAGCILLESKIQSVFRTGGPAATISISVTESDGTVDADELLLKGGKSMSAVKVNKRG